VIMPLVKSASPELEFVKTLGNNNLGEGHTARMVLSICTGALFLGAAGFLGNMRATTHHLFLEELRCICKSLRTHLLHGIESPDAAFEMMGLIYGKYGGRSDEFQPGGISFKCSSTFYLTTLERSISSLLIDRM
jgi:hypothetical protein